MSTSTTQPSNFLPAALDLEVGIPRLGLLSDGGTPAGRRSTGREVWRWRDFILAYKTLGVVFGGLVTSPLYVYPSMNLNSPTEEDYLGIYSIMFWTLTLIGVFKYVFIALNADDNGEGLVALLVCFKVKSARRILERTKAGKEAETGTREKPSGSIDF